MKLALSLLVWTLIALAALYVLGPDTSRELPKPKPPPSHPADHASVLSIDVPGGFTVNCSGNLAVSMREGGFHRIQGALPA